MNKPITTPDLFRALSICIGKEKPATPYMVAKVMGASPGTVGDWMRGYRVMDEKHGQIAAEILGYDNDFVQLSLEAERKNKSGLDKIAEIFERAAMACQTHGTRVASAFALVMLSPTLAGLANEVCILCKTFSFFNDRFFHRYRPCWSPV